MAKKLGLGGGLKNFRTEVKELTILPELKGFIPQLTDEERKLLEESIINEGVREPLDIWINNDEHIIIDGHNRYELAQNNKVSFDTKEHKFKTIDEVKEWMLKKQLGRRNLTDASRTYMIGLLYNKGKSEKGKYNREEIKEPGTNGENKASVADLIAVETGTSPRTVKSAGAFVDGLEKLTPEFKDHILSGKEKVYKSDIQELANSEPEAPISDSKELKTEVQKVKEKKTKKTPIKAVEDKKETIISDSPANRKEAIEKPLNGEKMDLPDDEYLEKYHELRTQIEQHRSSTDHDLFFSVISDFIELNYNLTDFIKLANDGYTILRKSDEPTIHIKHFTVDKNSWRTLEKDFKSKAARDRRFKELLEKEKTIRG